jgi:hypothetical protein
MGLFRTTTGFSIELVNNRLERRGDHEGLPLYESLGGRIKAIAIVKDPAIEVGVIADDDTREIYGPVMIPDLKIFRDTGADGKEEQCYWYFSKDTIAKLQKTFKGKIKYGH